MTQGAAQSVDGKATYVQVTLTSNQDISAVQVR